METICEKNCISCPDRDCPQRRAPIVGRLIVSEDSPALSEGLDNGNFDFKVKPDAVLSEGAEE